MALTQEQREFCYYVIATVETGCDYGGVNQFDAITLGITQWYGQNAWRLLDAVRTGAPDAYQLLSQRLRDLCEGGSQTWSYWTNVYLQNDDASSWVAAAEIEACRQVQDQLFMSDVFGEGGNADVLAGWGVVEDAKRVIFLLSMYHQRPASAASCVGTLGGSASIDTLLQWCLADKILGQYQNRYRKVHELLSAWDGTSAPPDFGQVDTDLPSDPSDNIAEGTLQTTVGYVMQRGNDLVIVGAMTETDRLICHSTGKGIWIPVVGTVPENPGTGTPGTDTPADPGTEPDEFAAMREVWEAHEQMFGYSQGPGRLDPVTYGYSDCSGCLLWAVRQVAGSKYDWIGASTRDYLANVPIVYDTASGELPLDVLRPGDMLLIDWVGSVGHGGAAVEHVDWYWGNGVVWGAGSAPLPRKITDDVTTYYVGRVNHVWVGRFLS